MRMRRRLPERSARHVTSGQSDGQMVQSHGNHQCACVGDFGKYIVSIRFRSDPDPTIFRNADRYGSWLQSYLRFVQRWFQTKILLLFYVIIIFDLHLKVKGEIGKAPHSICGSGFRRRNEYESMRIRSQNTTQIQPHLIMLSEKFLQHLFGLKDFFKNINNYVR